MRIGRTMTWISLALCLGGGGPAVAQEDIDARGRALYESRCGGCHDRSVHERSSRTARSFAALRDQVERWDRNLGTLWRPDEIEAVARYLNARFYRLPCEAPACEPRGTTRAPGRDAPRSLVLPAPVRAASPASPVTERAVVATQRPAPDPV